MKLKDYIKFLEKELEENPIYAELEVVIVIDSFDKMELDTLYPGFILPAGGFTTSTDHYNAIALSME